MADWVPLQDVEVSSSNYTPPLRTDPPDDPHIERLVNELVGAVLRQITTKDTSTPVFVLGAHAEQVVTEAWKLFAPWVCAANRKGDFVGWSVPTGFNRMLSFDLADVEYFEDLEPGSAAWFRTIWCTLPEGIKCQGSPYCRELIALHHVESSITYESFIGKRELTDRHIVICTSQTLRPSKRVAFVIRTDEVEPMNQPDPDV